MRSALPRALAALAALALLAACGGDSKELKGIVRSDPLVVGDSSVTEATTGTTPAPFHFTAAKGELLVVYFGYTNCPDVCPTTLASLRSAVKELGDDGAKVDLAMITVDPDRDTPEILSSYLGSFATRYHALVPASQEELKAAEEAFLASSEVRTLDDGTIQVDHSGNAYVVDEAGTVVVEWPFGHAKEGMLNDLQVLFGRM